MGAPLMADVAPAGCTVPHSCCSVSCPLPLQVAAKKLDRRLLDLGALPLLPRGLGDDQHPSG